MKKVFKWTGILVLGVLVVLILSGTALYVKGGSALEQKFAVPKSNLVAATDSASLAHGEKLVRSLGCTECHTGSLSGEVMVDAPPFLVVASNLTPGKGGVGSKYSAADFDRAIRQGVRPDGTPLLIMPSKAFHNLASDDVAALVGYLQSLPAIDNELPKTMLRPLGRVLTAAGQFDVSMEVSEQLQTLEMAPPVGNTVEYGHYRAAICAYCHQADFKGGVEMGPGAIPPDINRYAQMPAEKLLSTLRTGVTPEGRELDVDAMPVAIFQNWSDDEIMAVHTYMASR